MLAIPNVVAVQQDKLNQPTTDSSTEFIGADRAVPRARRRAPGRRGVIFGVLDTGVWPEHPSFADQGNLGAPRPRPTARRACDFGDNPLTPAIDPFVCNNKLIGGRPFLDTYLSIPAGPPPSRSTPPATPTATAPTPARRRPATPSTRAGVRRRARPDQRHRPGRLGLGLQGLRHRGLLRLRLRRGRRAGDPRRRRRDQLLDLRRHRPVHRSRPSWRSSTPTRPACSSPPRPATTAPVRARSTTCRRGSTTVAASTQTREFQSTLTLTGADGDTLTFTGASITAGVDAPLPVVLSSAAPYSNALCDAAGCRRASFTGKIVACQRGVERPRREGLQRPPGRRRRDDPVQPDARRHRDRQPLAADGPPRRRHRLRRLHGGQPGVTGDVHRPASRPTARAT